MKRVKKKAKKSTEMRSGESEQARVTPAPPFVSDVQLPSWMTKGSVVGKHASFAVFDDDDDDDEEEEEEEEDDEEMIGSQFARPSGPGVAL